MSNIRIWFCEFLLFGSTFSLQVESDHLWRFFNAIIRFSVRSAELSNSEIRVILYIIYRYAPAEV